MKNFCTGCGACSSICPKKAINMIRNKETGIFLPIINSTICNECGLCLSVCPAVYWSNAVYKKQSHYALGDYIQAYAAFSLDQSLRTDAASGGVTTAILQSLLDQSYITGAVVSRRVTGKPFQTETIIARTLENIGSCKGSIYSPVCFSEIYSAIKNASSDEKLAFVGLPCHIQALSLLMKQNSTISKKIAVTISLVCGHTPSAAAYKYSLRCLNLTEDDVVGLNNRGDGWPGYLRLYLKNGDIKKVPYGDSLSWGMVLSSPLFMPQGCHVCPDPGGFAADIMVCDAWLTRYKNNQEGVNLALAKTVRGNMVIQESERAGSIKTKLCPIEDFLIANKRVFIAKTINHKYALRYLVGKESKLFHKNIREPAISVTFLVKAKLAFYYFHLKIVRLFKINKIAKYYPKLFLFYFKALGLLRYSK